MKILTCLLVSVMILGAFPLGAGATVTPISVLGSVEELLYGELHTGALIQRIERVERDIYGSPQSGAVMVRIDRVKQFLEANERGAASLRLQLNMAEWGFFARLTDGQPLINRLETLETELLGTPQPGALADRARDMMMMIWGTTDLDIRQVDLKEQTLVKIRILTEVDSAKAREGDAVRYRIAEDVIVDGRVVVPAGAEGVGRVTEVQSAGRMGRDGRVVVNFGQAPALDGTGIRLQVDERATEKNRSLELAAGASMAGILLLGPIGLATGYFVQGRDVKIEAGSEFFLETERTQRVTGFLLRPAVR